MGKSALNCKGLYSRTFLIFMIFCKKYHLVIELLKKILNSDIFSTICNEIKIFVQHNYTEKKLIVS